MSRRSFDDPSLRMCWRSTSSFVSPRAARADAAAGAAHRLAPAAQARQQVVQLRELHLRLALAAPRVQREDVQDQRGPVDHLDAQPFLEGAELTRRQLVVEDHGAASLRMDRSCRSSSLPLPDRTWRDRARCALCTTRATGSAPAESASAASSSRSASAIPGPTPTSTARSRTDGRQVADSGDSSSDRPRGGRRRRSRPGARSSVIPWRSRSRAAASLSRTLSSVPSLAVPDDQAARQPVVAGGERSRTGAGDDDRTRGHAAPVLDRCIARHVDHRRVRRQDHAGAEHGARRRPARPPRRCSASR